jgi:hypothetical protein
MELAEIRNYGTEFPLLAVSDDIIEDPSDLNEDIDPNDDDEELEDDEIEEDEDDEG